MRPARLIAALWILSGPALGAPAEGEPAAEPPAAPEAAAPTEAPAPTEPDPTEDAAEPEPSPDPRAGWPPEARRLAAELEQYRAVAAEYHRDLERLAAHRKARRTRLVDQRYESNVARLAAEERARRAEAIEQFEAFLARFPDDPRFTPDTLFRLAELHFEKSNDAYVTALERYDAALAAAGDGPAPPEPLQEYGRTIALFEQLLDRWPDDRNADGALYLLGYCRMETGQEEAAFRAFDALVQRFPDSRFAAETWTRIGEYHFETGALAEAMAAYRKVLGYPDSPYYDKALYKLAWTHYRLDEYPEAIERFREIVEFSDDKARKTGTAGSDLRAEAIQYLAVSLQEDDWDGDGEPDAGAGVDRVLRYADGQRPYDVEVLRSVAGVFFDNTRYEDAIAIIRHLFESFPLDPGNPALHAQLIAAYERLQRVDDAFGERGRLASLYGTGSRWREANRDDPEALDAGAELLEGALITAATWHHARAQDLRAQAEEGDAAAGADAQREYRLAAVAYDNYLEQYPDSENAYELAFFFAECLYYAGRFVEAAERYAAVRDDPDGEKYRELAGFSAIVSHEKAVDDLIAQGRLAPKPSLTGAAPEEPEESEDPEAPADARAADGPAGPIEIVPEPIPDPVAALISARETYIDRGLSHPEKPDRLPIVAYKAGEIWFDYQHFDEARKWFSWLIQRFPDSEVAKYAANNIIETFRRANDWKKMAEWAEIIAEAGLGREFDDEIRTLKVGALFKEAEQLFAAERYEEAAAEYIRLVEENPGNRFAAAALNNAAVAFEKTRRFESATRTYERIVREHGDSEFAENALFRVGINAERFYDFDKAISTHLALVERFPDFEKRADALYQAARLLEQTRQYAEAAEAYQRYAELFPDREDTAETFYRAARVYEKLERPRDQIRIYDTFVRRYGDAEAQDARVVEALAAIARLHEESGRTRQARAGWQRVIEAFDARGMQPGTYEARYPAEARFELVEDDFEDYRALELKGTLSRQKRTLEDMQARIKALNAAYAEVLPYKAFEWNLAAFYRLGHIYQIFAERLYEAPIPETLSADEQDVYRTTLEDIALPIEDEAVKRYEQAYDKAREFRVTNIWTRRILQALNKYKPSDYPLFKEEKRVTATRQLTPPRLLAPPAAEGAPSPPPPLAPPPPTPAAPAPIDPEDDK